MLLKKNSISNIFTTCRHIL